jgi:hypothetical protein
MLRGWPRRVPDGCPGLYVASGHDSGHDPGRATVRARHVVQDGRGRRPDAWERGLVPSSIPAGEQKKKCLECRAEHQAKQLKSGYCPTCWTPAPGEAASVDRTPVEKPSLVPRHARPENAGKDWRDEVRTLPRGEKWRPARRRRGDDRGSDPPRGRTRTFVEAGRRQGLSMSRRTHPSPDSRRPPAPDAASSFRIHDRYRNLVPV